MTPQSRTRDDAPHTHLPMPAYPVSHCDPADLPHADTETTSPRRWAPFVAVEAATVMAGVANGITMVAFPWLVLETTGSPAAAGVIAGVTAVPMIIASLFSGTVVDMVGRRLTSIVSDLLSLLSVVAVPVAAALGRLDLAVLVVVAVLGAVFDPAGMTARESMLPGAARAARVPLERANGIHESMWGIAFVIGPALGGALIGLVGSTTTFTATAICFALSILCIAAVRIPDAGRPSAEQRNRGVLGSTMDGLRFLWSTRLLRVMAIYYMALIAGYMPIQAIVLPAWFQSQDRPEALGSLLLVMSIGGIIGSLAYVVIAHRIGRRRTFIVGTVLTVAPILGFVPLPPFGVMLALGFVSGVFWGPINPLVNLAVQRLTPSAMLGRVTGLFAGVAFALAPLGYFVAGLLYSAVGVQATLAVFGIVLVGLGVAMSAAPTMRALDTLPATPPGDATASANITSTERQST